jgi:hypothetical protein
LNQPDPDKPEKLLATEDSENIERNKNKEEKFFSKLQIKFFSRWVEYSTTKTPRHEEGL